MQLFNGLVTHVLGLYLSL